MSNQDISPALMSILLENINSGPLDDAEVCKDIAAYLNMLPMGVYYRDSLYEFISEYGEDVDESYNGRDEYGEKSYSVYNAETHWFGRIERELRALGYYGRQDEWTKERIKAQEAAQVAAQVAA